MPELFSRMDEVSWLTPSIADILEQGSQSGSDNSIRDIILTLQEGLNQLETPGRIVNVRNLTSHTLFITKPETIGRLGNRRTIRPEEIEASVLKLDKKHEDWLLGYTPTVPNEDADMVGIYLRTDAHRPLNLRRVLVRNSFRKYPSTMVAPIGIDLNQQMYLRDLADDGHIIIASRDGRHQHLVRSAILTLMLLNTPAELRLAIGGVQMEAYKLFVGAPHALGRLLTSEDNGQRLFDGLGKEIKRRQQLIANSGFETLSDYNDKLREGQFAILPRVLVVMDNVGDGRWTPGNDWQKALVPLLEQGASVGIHVLLAFHPDDKSLMDLALKASTRLVVMESAQKDLVKPVEGFHESLYPFIAGYAIEDKHHAVPIEIFTVSTGEVRQAVEYWRTNATQRQKDSIENISGKTGVTDVLVMPQDPPVQSPPIPDVPTVETLQKATQLLSRATDGGDTAEASSRLLDNIHMNRGKDIKSDNGKLKQARALGAYLGWLSTGALQDIFGCDLKEADAIMHQLQDDGVLERGQAIARFLKVNQT